MRDLKSGERERLAQLQRVKLMATLVLVACFIALICAKILEAQYPALAVLAAFAEAATIGGIADWYAVVALFKRPMGLPFPHTAIIPRNKDRIADNLGGFIETNFLARAPVEAKLREVDFASEMANWLSDPARARNLSQFVVRFIPQLLASIDEKGLVRFASAKITDQLAKTDISPMVGNVLTTFTKDGRHQGLLDEVIKALHKFLNDEETLDVIRAKVQAELPRLWNFFRADSLILNRLMRATTELLDEVQQDPDHPLRAEFEVFLKNYINRTKRTKAFGRRIETLKQQILARPELSDAADSLWASLRDYVLKDVQSDNSALAARLADLFVDVGTSLKSEPRLRADINAGMTLVISNIVDDQRENIAAYVSEQVRGWDIRQLLVLIEVNVGRDLQYIRFNGMIIGGCVGVLLYAIESLLLP